MAKILVADDETDLEVLILQKFRRQIRESKYEFVFALNGVEALEKLKENPDVDMVLTDINMPQMDGLTLLDKLKQVNPMLQSVIVSAYGDMENIRVAMNRGAYDFITKPVNFEDLEITMNKTLEHVRQLRETLQAVRENNILKMYVDNNVLGFMNSHEFENTLVRNETVQGSVMFIDICGFTSISETQPPDQVVSLINKIFDVLVQEILNHGGRVDKFIGDAIMAVFFGEAHFQRALETSLSVRKEIDKMEEEPSGFKVRVSTGINFGEMVCGNIGSMSLRRLDYTVIGDSVNLAQRLQGSATPNQILIAEHAYQSVKDTFNCRQVGETQLKNKSAPVMVYEVLD